MSKFICNLKPSPYDPRDYKISIKNKDAPLPSSADVSDKCTPVRNQGSIGACTAYSSTAAVEFLFKKNTGDLLQLSPYFTYYVTRADIAMQSLPLADNGAALSNAIKSLLYYGSCIDTIWPSNDEQKAHTLPTNNAYDDAVNQQIVGYAQVPTGGVVFSLVGPMFIRYLIAAGYPVVSGIYIYGTSFDNPLNGVIVTPTPTSADTPSGHAVLFVGYNNDGYTINGVHYPNAKFKFKNSWNTTWGDNGYGYLNEDYITNGWVIESWSIFQEDILRDGTNITINTIPEAFGFAKDKQIYDVFEQIKRLADFSKQLQVKNLLSRLYIKYNQNDKLSNFINHVKETVVNSLA